MTTTATALPGGETFVERGRQWYGAVVVVDGTKYRVQRYHEPRDEAGRPFGLVELAAAGPTWRANAIALELTTEELAWDIRAGVWRPLAESELRALAGDR